jgi:hypothetical protein
MQTRVALSGPRPLASAGLRARCVARPQSWTAGRAVRSHVRASVQPQEPDETDAASTSGSGAAAGASALAAASLLFLAGSSPALAAEAGASPFNGVTANSLYVTLALFLMSVPGEAGPQARSTSGPRGARRPASGRRRCGMQPRCSHCARPERRGGAPCLTAPRPSTAPPLHRDRRHLVPGEACAAGQPQAEDVRGARARGGGRDAGGRAGAPHLCLLQVLQLQGGAAAAAAAGVAVRGWGLVGARRGSLDRLRRRACLPRACASAPSCVCL